METKKKQTTENFIKEVRRKTRRTFSSEQKISIVMEALRAETSVAELCKKYSIFEAQFYKWNKEFLEAGRKRLSNNSIFKLTHRPFKPQRSPSFSKLPTQHLYYFQFLVAKFVK